jgi:Tfp pilus assembly protein PilF
MRSIALVLLAACAASAQLADQARTSIDLLFVDSDSAAALRESKIELRRNPSDLNALFARMEAARLQLRSDEELHSALLLLEKANGSDPRAQLAAGRIQELAANTPSFRNSVLRLCALLRENSAYSREITSALLKAREDGIPIARGAHLARRITRWQIAGPFGEFSNVDFDRSWPPERDQLAAPAYGNMRRERITSFSGELELPNYFPQSGVYYAASTFRSLGEQKYTITVEGDGTYELQLDGKRLLLHDSRFHSQKKIAAVETSVSVGNHHILLKLHPGAFPIRVWLQHRKPSQWPVQLGAAESYVEAANALRDGGPGPALAYSDDASAIDLTLRAEAQSQLQQSTKSRDSFLKASTTDSNNALAKLGIARQALAEERFEEAASYLAKVLDAAPSYWPAQELKYKIAVQFDWEAERTEALKALLHLHPDCSTYSEEAKLLRYDARGAIYRSRLAACSPRPSAYWSELSERGDHAHALATVEKYLQAHPEDRRTLELAIREAVLSENQNAAHRYAGLLKHEAPNWERAIIIAENPQTILDSPSAFSPAADFYLPYARNAVPLLVGSTNSTADDEVLINDRVVKLDSSGSAWLYQHSVVQAFDKKGIEAAGEVEIPPGADLIELRTVKHNGGFAYPELGDRKTRVSMPSLAEGDAVELAYVQHLRASELQTTPELLDFFFASAEAQTGSSRLTIIREGASEPRLWISPGVREIESRLQGNTRVSTWEATDLPAAMQEPHAPQCETRSRILWLSIRGSDQAATAFRYRDELIAATPVSPLIEQTASNIRATNPRDAIASAYQLVEASIDEDGGSWRRGDITSASESLAQGEGNRAATLVALLSAMGFDADLELAAERDQHSPNDECPNFRCYTHPLIRVALPNAKRPMVLDPQLKGAAAGALSPEVEGEKALVISRARTDELEIATVPQGTDQKSRAVANLELGDDGALRGTVRIRFGSFKGAQMRAALRQLSAKDRQNYFEEIGSRIFPHASKISASVFHEDDPEKPLELELSLKASATSPWNGSSFDLGQLVPALGLSRLYAILPERKQDLWLETPLVEESEFTVRLPSGVEVWRMPEAFTAKTTFGEYHTDFRLEDGALKIVRSFRIPMQRIAPAQYPEFSKFALQIDNVEREQLELRRVAVAQERPSPIRSLR